jgi:hypothetical protein
MGQLRSFYTNQQKNPEGLYLKDIWGFNDWELENTHHFIQWMFPLELKSNHNETAPVVCDKDLMEMVKDKEVRENILHSLNVMENFWGFEVPHKNCSFTKPRGFQNFLSKDWPTAYNHNYIRIARVIHSLVIFGLENEAKELVGYLEKQVFPTYKHLIGEDTMDYWKSALDKGVSSRQKVSAA